MAKEFEFTFDTGKLGKWLHNKASQVSQNGGVPPGAVVGMKEAMLDLQMRVAGGVPDVGAPVDTGLLRSSVSTGVQGRFLSSSPDVRGADSTKKGGGRGGRRISREFDGVRRGQLVGQVGANTEYAAKVHEEVQRGRISGRGKYIEANIRENMQRYMVYIAKRCKEWFQS